MERTGKLAAIQRMIALMKEHKLKYVYLKQSVATTHPGFDKPGSDKRPYVISEVCYDAKEDCLLFWQHWSDYHVGKNAEGFEDEKVFSVERALIETIASLKKYEVKVAASAFIMAPSAARAIETVRYMASPEIHEVVCCIVPTGEAKECC